MPYDFFVSYARSDNTTGWITRFVEELLAEHKRFSAGHELKPFFDLHDITTGADWQLYLAHGIAHSRLFLAFLSPNYFASEWCRREWRAWMDAEIAQHILTAGVRPIYIVEVPGLTGKGQLSDQQLAQKLADLSKLPESDRAKLIAETPPVVKHLRRRQLTHNQPFCDVHAFFDVGLDALRREDLRQVLDQLAHDLDHHAELLAQADASVSTVPAYNKNFTGRLDELLALRERLIKDDRTGVIYGVHGLGGIGKTELAFTYAHAYASAYPGGRFLIRYEGKSSLRDAVLGQSDFTALFRDISDEDRKQPDTYFAAIVARLRDRLAQLGHVLLVLDNVSDFALLEPEQTDTLTVLGPKLHLLATTRLVPPTSGKSNWLSLGRLPDDDALDLLEKHRPFASDAERDAARRIVQRLGGFTLTVELVAAWLAKHRGTTCAQFLERPGMASLEGFDALAEERDVKLRRHNDERRLAAVLDPTLDALAPAERRALEYAALLPPDHVALPWLRALVGKDFPVVANDDEWLLLLDQLTGLTLFIRPDTETSEPHLMTVHRLVQDQVRARMTPDDLAAQQQAVDKLVKERDKALEKVTRWEDARWELEPLEALAWLWAEPVAVGAEERSPSSSTSVQLPHFFHPGAAWLLNKVGHCYCDLGRWSEAESLYRRALAIAERYFGPDDPWVGKELNYLVQVLRATNQLAESEPLCRRALMIAEKIYGQTHPEVTHAIDNLGQLLMVTNRPEEAEPLLRRALAIEEQSFGPEHPGATGALNNLAQLLNATNRVKEAEILQRRALAIGEKHYGGDHIKIAPLLNNLATLLLDTNRLTEAEPLLRRALAIEEQSFGPEHPGVALTLNNLAQLLQATSRLEDAEMLMRRVIPIFERSCANHPNVATSLNNLAWLLSDTNRLEEAEPLRRRALVIDEASFGADHPNVARDLNNLAQLLQATNRLTEAEPLLRRALAIREKTPAPDHPDTLSALQNLADLLAETGKVEECNRLREEFADRILQTKTAIDPLNKRQLALHFFRHGDYERAKQLMQSLLAAGFDPASTRHHLARLCLITSRFSEAREHVTQGWAARADAKPYIVARLLWFQLALEMLEESRAGSPRPTAPCAEGTPRPTPALLLGRLKTALQNDGAFMEWTMQPVLDHLKSKLLEKDIALLTALVATLNDRTKLPELDQLPEWRAATPQPLD